MVSQLRDEFSALKEQLSAAKEQDDYSGNSDEDLSNEEKSDGGQETDPKDLIKDCLDQLANEDSRPSKKNARESENS